MRIYGLVMRNFWWKVTSILVATVLWVALWVGQVEESRKDGMARGPMATFVYEEIPIIMLTSAAETNRFKLDPAYARVKVKAKSNVLEEMDSSSVRVFVELLERPTTNVFRASLELELGEGLQGEFVEPREVTVRVVRDTDEL